MLTKGTAAKSLANFPYPAAGKTGTQQDNTNSWFVGATPQLTTAVWVGDPDAYTPMINIPEFIGVGKVQGATYPARIWGALMEPALAPLPLEDWAAPPEPARKPVRLYLPGNECLAKLVSGVLPGGPTTTTVDAAPGEPRRDGPRGRATTQAGAEGDPQRHHHSARCARPHGPHPDHPDHGHDRLPVRQASRRRRDYW